MFFWGYMEFKFLKWDKYNKRQKDIKRPFWFAMSNEFFYDPDFVDFTDQERLTFIFLLGEASKQNSYGEVNINEVMFSRITGYSKQVLFKTLDKLLKLGVTAGNLPDGGRIATATQQNKTVHNSTEHNTLALSDPSDASSQNFPESLSLMNLVWIDRGVKKSALEAMLIAFPEPDFIIQETKKALAWEATNPGKKKINFSRFLNNWLARSWDSRKHPQAQGYQKNNKGIMRPSTERSDDLDNIFRIAEELK